MRPSVWHTMAGLSALMVLFVAAGWPLMKGLGIEADEAMIGDGIYERAGVVYSWRLFGHEVPVMLISYLGALKTWIYNALFAMWPPGPLSLRLPMMLVGAATLALFFMLMDRTLGRRAAWIGTSLLATDPSFIVTESIDFGFVAFQHAFKLGGLLLLVAHHHRPSTAKLAGAFFLWGLAMWDKAVFSWLLFAIGVAGVLVFWREVRQHLSIRNVVTAVSGFIVGALPFVIYNIERPLETFRQSVRLAPDNPFIKMVLLKRTFDGSGLFGFITGVDSGPHPGDPHGVIQRAAFTLSKLFQAPVTSWMLWAFAVAALATPLLWRTPARRPVLFSLLFLAITWIQMFVTTGAGGAVHHVILLWPFHLLVVAAVLNVLRRPVAVTLAVLLCFTNLLVVNQYHVALKREGTGVRWTDAFSPLAKWLHQSRSTTMVTVDWGIFETLHLMSEGELPLQDASTAVRYPDQSANHQALSQLIAKADTVWVTHSPPAEVWLGQKTNLVQSANSLGYSQELVETIHDRNGRAIFEILRFRRGG